MAEESTQQYLRSINVNEKLISSIYNGTRIKHTKKLIVENEQSLGARFGIRSIPTLMVFKEGKEVHRVSGALDETSLKQLVSQFL